MNQRNHAVSYANEIIHPELLQRIMKIIFKDRNLSVLFASTFLFFTNEALFLPTLPLHLSSDGYNHTKIGIVLGAFALGVLSTRPLAGYITDHKGRKISLITGVSVFLAAPLLYLVSTDFFYLILVRFVHGLGISFYTTAFPAYISDASAEHERGEVFGHMATSTTLALPWGHWPEPPCLTPMGLRRWSGSVH